MIRLEDVGPGNWRHPLEVAEEQKRWVANSAVLLARAYAYRNERSRAFLVCDDKTPVGMGLYYDVPELEAYAFSQLFIDARYQGKGYGRAATRLVLDALRRDKKYNRVVLCYVEGNEAAKQLYESFGFVEYDRDGDEIGMELVFREKRKSRGAQVYAFRAAYERLEEKIWRTMEVSSNYRLDQLGYAVLAAFDTRAYHLFEFEYQGERFEIPSEDYPYDQIDMGDFRLKDMGMEPGDRIRMDYDFGTTQTFQMELVAVRDMERGNARHYPWIVDGAGRGIIDDVSCGELQELIDQIDRNGRTDVPIYYAERRVPWDYRVFDLELENRLFKGEIDAIEQGYLPLWGE